MSQVQPEKNMSHISIDDLTNIFTSAENATSAVRAIVPYYEVTEKRSPANRFITDKVVQHFRANNKPDGVYRLGHDLELVLGDKSEIRPDPPF